MNIMVVIEKMLAGANVDSKVNSDIAQAVYEKIDAYEEASRVYVLMNQSPAINLIQIKDKKLIPLIPFLNPQQAWVEKNPAAVKYFKDGVINRKVVYVQQQFSKGLSEAIQEKMADKVDLLIVAAKAGSELEKWARSRTSKKGQPVELLAIKDGNASWEYLEETDPKDGEGFKPGSIKEDAEIELTEELYEEIGKKSVYKTASTAAKTAKVSSKKPVAKIVKGGDFLDAAPAPSTASASASSAPSAQTALAAAPSVAQATAQKAQAAQKMVAKAQEQKQTAIQAVSSAASAPTPTPAPSRRVAFSAIFADIAESQKAMAECQRIMAMAMAEALDK